MSAHLKDGNVIAIFESINSEMEAYIDSKNFIKKIHGHSKSTKELIDYVFDLRSGKKSLGEIYNDALRKDPLWAANSMGEYLNLANKLGRLEIHPIKEFLLSETDKDNLTRNYEIFIREALPKIYSLDLFQDFKKNKINIKTMAADFPGVRAKTSIQIDQNIEMIFTLEDEANSRDIDSYYSHYLHPPYSLEREFDESVSYIQAI
jgi:hypothetical protein